MCDYRQESKNKLHSLGEAIKDLKKIIAAPAYFTLLRAIDRGRVRQGCDLHTGKVLPWGAMAKGHYLTDDNFKNELERMEREPHKCLWCGSPLPEYIMRNHFRPHNHREYISHHYHPKCWDARLLAIAIIFGHITPDRIVRSRRYQPLTLKKVIVKKIYASKGRRG